MERNSSSDEDPEIVNGPVGFGRAVAMEKPDQCLQIRVQPKSDRDQDCWESPGKCPDGFSASIWIKVAFRRDDNETKVIFSTGACEKGGPGLCLSFTGIFVHVLLSTGEQKWYLKVPGPVQNNTWNEMGLRWSKDDGLHMFVNGELAGKMLLPEAIKPAQSREGEFAATVGCRIKPDGGMADFAGGEYDELTAWMRFLPENDTDYFLGGHDPNTTCDAETHPLKCETNIGKILENMGNTPVESVDDLCQALEHLNKLSGGNGESNDDGNDGNKEEELRMFVSIIRKLIAMTWDKPKDISVKELEDLMVVQDMASNLLDPKHTDGWQKLQSEGTTSVDFLNQVTAYQIQKTKQTDNGKEPIDLVKNSSFIFSNIRKSMLYSVLADGKPISFPENDDGQTRKKREANENDDEDDANKVQISVTNNLYGEVDKQKKVIFAGSSYTYLERLAPLYNAKTGNQTYLVFLDSEIISASCEPNASSAALDREPVLVTLKHRRKVKATGRKLLADRELEDTGEIRRRDCMRWDPDLEVTGNKGKGGWTSDGCTMANTSADETVCQCTQLGTFAVMSKIRKPFDIPPEDEWVKLCKWICFSISVALLVFYVGVILFRKPLHEQFHIVRFNMAVAALGAMVSFALSGFFYEDEEVCRVLSVLIHFFYFALGLWLACVGHSLFAALVCGSFGGKTTLHVMIGWVVPACMVGGCFTVFQNYGYDYRCLVGPTAARRWLLVTPILLAATLSFVFSILTCINYGTPAVKKTAIVNELSSATRAHFVVSLLFLCTWLCGVFALVDLGFDEGELPAFNPIFQILNACTGIFIVILIGLGSKHFRYSLCHSGKSKTQTKAMNLDPFDIHDKATVNNRKKIYMS